MSRLRIFTDGVVPQLLSETSVHEHMAHQLGTVGIRFERWHTEASLVAGADSATVLAAYRQDIERLKRENGYMSVDVVSLTPEYPDKIALREKFLSEHCHREDEVRFFVAGRGLFSLHVEKCVYEVLCEQGDLISVPADTPHWFDMGATPSFTAIRLFTNPEGWVAHYTDDTVASRFPRLED